MTTVQLLVADEPNRNALLELLDQRYDVSVVEALQRADCYLIDDHTLPDYREELTEHKAEQHPTFTPVILIRREDTRQSVDLPDTSTGEGIPLVDEVVSAPIDPAVLYRRIDNLAVRRDQSLTLTRQYEVNKARFEALFDAIPNPAFVLNESGEVIEVNDAFCTVLGTTQRDVIGEPLEMVQGLGLNFTAHVDHMRASGGVRERERIKQFTGGDGKQRYGVFSMQSVVVEEESYTVGVLADITKLKEKTERLEEFASILAHDVRNPLQVAQARLEMIEDRLDDSEHVGAMNRSLDRIEDLIEKLLTIARTGEDDLERTSVTVGECARKAWEMVMTGEATLDVEQSAELVIEADGGRLVELFENLMRNAIEHGGSSVTVRVGGLSDGFFVEDDGPGIPTDQTDEVFEMGFTTESQGTGLGLSIVQEIADVHDWIVTVSEGEGARFEFTGMAIRDVS